jgi:feruloyl esterase
VWIPERWNGKLVATGNGGYANVPSYRDMAYALRQGYAAAGGDTGHQTTTPDDLLWGVDHPERIEDWGSRSVHAWAAPARAIVEGIAGRRPRRSYFYGCSTGGHQAYAEMQRYPADFDGIVAGAPGNNRVRLNTAFLWQFVANRRKGDPTPILSPVKLPLITSAIVAACDANDGVTDGVVDDPRTCAFDPATLSCRGDATSSCLTEPELGALHRLYDGARRPNGQPIYPGWPKSSEALTTQPNGMPGVGWHQYWGVAEPVRANFWRYWVFGDPKWDWWSFDFDRDVARAEAKVGGLIDQNAADLSAFRRRGGKAIVYQGWQDPVVNALDTIAYVDRVRNQAGADNADGFLRLFLVPGMGHCSGGTGTTNFGNQNGAPPVVDARHDLLSALDAWVEQGLAPARIIASRIIDGKTTRTRPLCPYPQRAVYTGSGSTDDAANFVCRAAAPRAGRR